MFEQLFRATDTVEQYQAAPLAESRLRYLRHWLKLGARRSTLRMIAINQLEVVRLLDLREVVARSHALVGGHTSAASAYFAPHSKISLLPYR